MIGKNPMLLHITERFHEFGQPFYQDCSTPLEQTFPYKLFVNIAHQQKTKRERESKK